MPQNPYEHAARLQKSYKLASYLYRGGDENRIYADEVKLITDEQWKVIAKLAGTNPPRSSEQ